MKWLSAILLVYIMVLTFIPCADHAMQRSNNLTEQYSKADQHSTEQEDHGKDTCTPFCICSCCGISLIVADLRLFNIEQPFEAHISSKILSENFVLVSSFLNSIWQPPRV